MLDALSTWVIGMTFVVLRLLPVTVRFNWRVAWEFRFSVRVLPVLVSTVIADP